MVLPSDWKERLARLRENSKTAHIIDGIIRVLHYHTTFDKLPRIEEILRDEFGLVDEDRFKDVKGKSLVLVYERAGPDTGLYRVHFYPKLHENSIVKFGYWDIGRQGLIPQEYFIPDPMKKALERIYKEIKPHRVSGVLQEIEVEVPWK